MKTNHRLALWGCSALCLWFSVAETASAQPPWGGRGGPPGMGGRPGPQMLQRFDANEDGQLSEDEVPEAMWARLSRADADEDGAVTREELAQFMRQRSEQRRDVDEEESSDEADKSAAEVESDKKVDRPDRPAAARGGDRRGPQAARPGRGPRGPASAGGGPRAGGSPWGAMPWAARGNQRGAGRGPNANWGAPWVYHAEIWRFSGPRGGGPDAGYGAAPPWGRFHMQGRSAGPGGPPWARQGGPWQAGPGWMGKGFPGGGPRGDFGPMAGGPGRGMAMDRSGFDGPAGPPWARQGWRGPAGRGWDGPNDRMDAPRRRPRPDMEDAPNRDRERGPRAEDAGDDADREQAGPPRKTPRGERPGRGREGMRRGPDGFGPPALDESAPPRRGPRDADD